MIQGNSKSTKRARRWTGIVDGVPTAAPSVAGNVDRILGDLPLRAAQVAPPCSPVSEVYTAVPFPGGSGTPSPRPVTLFLVAMAGAAAVVAAAPAAAVEARTDRAVWDVPAIELTGPPSGELTAADRDLVVKVRLAGGVGAARRGGWRPARASTPASATSGP
jgi:hypothetical protein